MVTVINQFATARFDGRRYLTSTERRLRIQRRRQGLYSLIKRIEQDQSVTPKQRSHHARECLAIRASGSPRVAQHYFEVRGEFRAGKEFEQLIDNRLYGAINDHAANRLVLPM